MAKPDTICVCDDCQKVFPLRQVIVTVAYGRVQARNIIRCVPCQNKAAHPEVMQVEEQDAER